MRLTRSNLRLIQEGLDMIASEAQLQMEYENDDAVLRWASETEDEAIKIRDKLDIIIDTLTKLHKRQVAADVILAPGAIDG